MIAWEAAREDAALLSEMEELLYAGEAVDPLDEEEINLRQQLLTADERDSQELARQSVVGWAEYTDKNYIAGWFHREVGKVLDEAIASIGTFKGFRTYILMAPPQHGKSELTAVKGAVYAMARRRGLRVGVATYGEDLADKHSLAARRLAASPAAAAVWGRPVVRLTREKSPLDKDGPTRIDYWEAWTSTYQAVGVGGGLTGHTLNLLIGDDLFAGPQDAFSRSGRQRVAEWLGAVGKTRLAEGSVVVLLGTPWHKADILHTQMATAHKVMRFPALADADEPHRKRGEALAPHMKSREFLEQVHSEMLRGGQASLWEALFMVRPGDGDSLFIDTAKLPRYTLTPEAMAEAADEVWASVDAGKKESADSDPTAIHVYAVTRQTSERPLKLVLLDRCALPGVSIEGLKQMLRRVWARWGRFIRRRGAVLVEDAANGAAVLQQGVASIGEPDSPTFQEGIPQGKLVPFVPQSVPGRDKSKEARAQWGKQAAQAGGLFVPEDGVIGEWAAVDEAWRLFPRVPHDEDVDCLSQLLIHLGQSVDVLSRLKGVMAVQQRLGGPR